jgi:hypothetical protein
MAIRSSRLSCASSRFPHLRSHDCSCDPRASWGCAPARCTNRLQCLHHASDSASVLYRSCSSLTSTSSPYRACLHVLPFHVSHAFMSLSSIAFMSLPFMSTMLFMSLPAMPFMAGLSCMFFMAAAPLGRSKKVAQISLTRLCELIMPGFMARDESCGVVGRDISDVSAGWCHASRSAGFHSWRCALSSLALCPFMAGAGPFIAGACPFMAGAGLSSLVRAVHCRCLPIHRRACLA